MKIRPVNTSWELRRFLDFPYKLHRNTHNWIPPLRIEQKKIFNPSRNAMLRNSDFQLYLLYEGKMIIGRIAAHINRHYNECWKERTGFFGHYECVEDQKAAVDRGEVEDLVGLNVPMYHATVRHRVKKTICVTNHLSQEDIDALGFDSAASVQAALERAYEIMGRDAKVGIIPFGGETLVRVAPDEV